MKFLLITMVALVGLATAQLPDSATQGPNPQDIATPEPEYIDIDEPEPGSSGSSASAPSLPPPAIPVQSRNFKPVPPRPVRRPDTYAAASSNARLIAQSYSSPQRQYQPIVQRQQPIMHHQQPIMMHQQPVMHHQQMILHHLQPVVQHQQIVQQQPIMYHQPMLQQFAYQQPILQQFQTIAQHQSEQQLPGHSYSSQSGYQYRRPVYSRRVYRHRY